MVALVTLGGGLASWLMIHGRARPWGPAASARALRKLRRRRPRLRAAAAARLRRGVGVADRGRLRGAALPLGPREARRTRLSTAATSSLTVPSSGGEHVRPDHRAARAPAAAGARRRGGIIAVVASVVVVVLVAAGGFAAWRFLSGGGPRPAEVLPASTFALVTVDLDPSGGQKVEAIKTLRKFPTFRDKSGLQPDSDPLKRLFEQIAEGRQLQEPRLRARRQVVDRAACRAGRGRCSTGSRRRSRPSRSATPTTPRRVSPSSPSAPELGRPLRLDPDRRLHRDQRQHRPRREDRGGRARSPRCRRTPTSRSGPTRPVAPGIVNAYVGPKALDVALQELSSGLEDLGDLSGDGLPGSSNDAEAARRRPGARTRTSRAPAPCCTSPTAASSSPSPVAVARRPETKATVADHVAAMPADTALLLAFAVPPGAFKALENADPNGSASELPGQHARASTSPGTSRRCWASR